MRWILCLLILLLPPTAAAQESAHYEIGLDITWSAASHPLEFPGNAHLSRVVIVSHNARYVLFADGDTASSGLELVAENGRPSILMAEIEEALRRRRIGAVFEGAALGRVPGRIAIAVEVDRDHPLVSLVTMIAPSPDWFTGVAGVQLHDGESWVDNLEFVLWAWDAGTDSGGTYDAPDQDTQPRSSTRLVATPHFLTASSLAPVGTARFTRVD